MVPTQYKPPRFAIFELLDILENFEKHILIIFGRFSKLITFPVSAVASGWFFAVGSTMFSSKVVWWGQERPKLMYWKTSTQQSLLKRNVCQHFVALETGKRHFFYVILMQFIVFLVQTGRLQVFVWILAQSWHTSPPGKVLANVLPPNLEGYRIHTYIIFSI